MSNPDRTVDQWKLSTEIVTVVHDTAAVFADQVASIRKNLNDMGSKPKVDKDVPCQGQQAHIFEFSYGPEGKIVTTNRMLLPDGPSGLTTVTYTRTLDQFDPDVKKAIDNFCKPPA
ncbi:MAG: hypothetical protein GIW95_03655 [Candidatus Eremiobacteraeota bacterium]|nr:hypothetical protein [Candidatus Eremiobacteraeota bacterium]